MALTILFVGGVYPAEYSLYKESQINPELIVKFLCGSGCMPDVEEPMGIVRIGSKEDVDRVKAEFCPDLTIFRSWCSEVAYMGKGDVLWSQEIYASAQDENKSVKKVVGGVAGIRDTVAFQNKVFAKIQNQYWLPYCVSSNWEKSYIKDIPIMVASSFPVETAASENKLWSFDVLVKPLVEHMPDKVHVYPGYGGGIEKIPYLNPCVKNKFPPSTMTDFIGRAAIYISPTSILYDEGSISHKTVQAMACGCVVVANKYPGIEEIVGKDGDTIIYCNTLEDTLEKVKYYLNHEKERQELAQRGMDFVYNKYSWLPNLIRVHKEITE